MFWGDFSKELRMEEQKRFVAPLFKRYQKPAAKVVPRKLTRGKVMLLTGLCNDCPFEKVTVKQCKKCRGK